MTDKPTTRILLVYNPLSGVFVGREPADIEQELLAETGQYPNTGVRLFAFDHHRLDHLGSVIHQENPAALWVAGGDGTIAAVSEIAGRMSLPMGILPAGTINLLGRDLGMETDITAAVEQLRRAKPKSIDTTAVNGLTFLNIANLGISTCLTRMREQLRRVPGWARWPMLGAFMIRSLFVYPEFKGRLDINGKERTVSTRSISVSNTPLRAGKGLLPERNGLNQSQMGVYLVRETSFWSMPRLMIRLLTGTWQDDADLDFFTCTRLTVFCPGRKQVHMMVDGEIRRLKPPLEFIIRPASLTVLVPEEKE